MPEGTRARRLPTLLSGLVGLAVALAVLISAAPAHAQEARDVATVAEGPRTLGDGTTQAAAAAAAGPYHLQFRHSGKCVEDPGYSRTSGKWMDQWTCVAQSNELWYFDYVMTSGGAPWYRIRNAYSGMCLTINGNSPSNSAAVIQYRCGAYGNQYFALAYNGNVPSPYYWIQAFNSRKCLNIQGASTSNGAKLIQYTCGYYNNEYVRLY